MPNQFTTILQTLGVPEPQITALEGLTEDQLKEFKPDEVAATIRENIRRGALEDADFLNTIPEEKLPEPVRKKHETAQYKRYVNELTSIAKQNGINLDDVPEEDRHNVKKVTTFILNAFAKKGGGEGLQELQTQLQQLQTQTEQKETEWQNKLNTSLEEANGKANTRIIKYLTQGEIASLKDIQIPVPAKYIVDPVLNEINNEYAVILSDTDEILLRQKANPQLKVLVNGKEVLFKDVLKDKIIKKELGVEKKPAKPDGEQRKVIVDGDKTVISSHIKDKIEKKINEEKTA